jgi:hypothetical protein
MLESTVRTAVSESCTGSNQGTIGCGRQDRRSSERGGGGGAVAAAGAAGPAGCVPSIGGSGFLGSGGLAAAVRAQRGVGRT